LSDSRNYGVIGFAQSAPRADLERRVNQATQIIDNYRRRPWMVDVAQAVQKVTMQDIAHKKLGRRADVPKLF
jgi:hypothetical protein